MNGYNNSTLLLEGEIIEKSDVQKKPYASVLRFLASNGGFVKVDQLHSCREFLCEEHTAGGHAHLDNTRV